MFGVFSAPLVETVFFSINFVH